MNLEGQMHGGVVQGIGYALTEKLFYKNGKVLNPSFTDYKMPIAPDIPEIMSIFVEEPDSNGPYGARGVGEGPITPTAAAIANAIYDAVGVRIKELPITSEKILKALREKEG